jgi:hypothetical protein
MCSGLTISDQLSAGVKNEVRKLFGADQFGVRCIGENGQVINFGTGGRRPIECIIKTENQATYKIEMKAIENIKGKTSTEKSAPSKWVLQPSIWRGPVSPGGEGYDAVIFYLDIPSSAPTSLVKIDLLETNEDTGSTQLHNLYIDVTPSGFLKTTLC